MVTPAPIRSSAEVERLAKRLEGAAEVALDCEFHSEGRYFPDLFLVQVADSEGAVAIDPRAAELARSAAPDHGYVLGSVGPTGEDLTETQYVDLYSEQAAALIEKRRAKLTMRRDG